MSDLIKEARDVLSRPIPGDQESEEARDILRRLADALARVTKDTRRESDIGMAVTFGVMRGLAFGPDDAPNSKRYDATFLTDTIREHVFAAIRAAAEGQDGQGGDQ